MNDNVFGNELHVDVGDRFINIRGNKTNLHFKNGYTYARIEKSSGDIYSATGKKSKGNIYNSLYNGLETVDAYGVIVNNLKSKKRLELLSSGDNHISEKLTSAQSFIFI